MATIILHPPNPATTTTTSSSSTTANPLPPLLYTPSGLALLELQGTLHVGGPGAGAAAIGRVDFPDYHHHHHHHHGVDDADADADDAAWMRRVYLWVGRHQRLTGEVRRLPRAVAVVRRRREQQQQQQQRGEELEIVEIVKYKIVFSSRPEPVGSVPG